MHPPNLEYTPETLSDDPQELWKLLNSIDPQRAENIHPHDLYRIKRALAIWYETGQKPSEYAPAYNPPSG